MRFEIYSDPNCQKCEGAGMYEHPDTGGMLHCDCHDKVRVIEMTRRAGFPSSYSGKTVGGYKADPKFECEVSARSKVIDWIKGYTHNADGLILSGTKGTGKTHLLVAIGKALVAEHNVQPLFTTPSDFLRATKARFSTDSDRYQAAEAAEATFDNMAEATVLLLDDLGSERQTEFSVDLLCDLINTRYAEGRTTIVTTNFSKAEIKKTYGDRFEDRLYDMGELVVINSPSRRQA